MADVERSFSPLRGSPLQSPQDEPDDLSTLPDPRSRALSPADATDDDATPHPDLSNEVATLSNKLISAINHQTSLDDTLSSTRHELDSARGRIRQLEMEVENYANKISSGTLIMSGVAQAEKDELLTSLAKERRQREEMEKGKKHMEQELENLTQALFEEANKMVISAREQAKKDQEVVERRNEQLKAQLADMESLLSSHQEQLAELKHVMEQMNEERDDRTNPTAPSTPSIGKFGNGDLVGHSSSVPNASDEGHDVPSYPTSFTNLLQMVLRTDLIMYEDFLSLLKMSKTVVPGSRASSGSYTAMGIGLGLGAYSNPISTSGAAGSTGSVTSLPNFGSSPGTPTTPGSASSTGPSTTANLITPLKETRFYKRALVEDIEPTLRLETAPGLSWLARRTVLSAMSEGTLVVEPIPASTARLNIYSCSLCGEARKDSKYMRTHRFRSHESDSAQRYPLCRYCLGRVRSTCDFLGFLRILKDGHWRTDDEESERSAWEESVRLREQMFWCRVGGGVVPLSPLPDSTLGKEVPPGTSQESRNETQSRLNNNLERLDGSTTENGDAVGMHDSGVIDNHPRIPDTPPSASTNGPNAFEVGKPNTTSASPNHVSQQGEPSGQRLSLTIPGAPE